jgi:hypothetical protein
MVIASRKAQGLPLRPAASQGKYSSFRTWTPEVAALTLIADRIATVVAAVFKAQGHKGVPDPKPLPRPRSAMDRVLIEERERAHKALSARVLPHKYKPAEQNGESA